MEPFGLFQFLQTLLSPPAPSAPAPQEPTPSPVADDAPRQTVSQKPAESETKPAPQKENFSQDAILRFMEDHDQRAKRLGK